MFIITVIPCGGHRRHKVWLRSTHACPRSIYRHGASSPLLATWLDQRSVRHGGSTAHGPFSIVGGLPAPHRKTRLSHLSTLQWCWRDGRTSGVTLPSTRPGAAGVMAKSPLSKRPKMPMELPGEDRGGDPTRPPSRSGMRERELCFARLCLCFRSKMSQFPWNRELVWFHWLLGFYRTWLQCITNLARAGPGWT